MLNPGTPPASASGHLNRYLRVTPGGLLRVDAAKIAAEEKLDGKYLLRGNEPHRSAEDLALGYKTAKLVHLPVHASWLNQVEICFWRIWVCSTVRSVVCR